MLTQSNESLNRSHDRSIGGQAVIEGVMIRSPECIATAVRDPQGQIVIRTDPYVSLTRRVRLFGAPIVRGIVSFGEMMAIGFSTLNYSAAVAMPEEDQGSKWRDVVVTTLTTVFAMVVGIALFFMLPLAIATALGLSENPLLLNLVAGMIRVGVLLAYLWGLGRVPDLRRVFAYHGAEHQVVFAYESGEELTVEAARTHSRFHPRCGTSFLLIVVLLSVLAYALIDTGFYILTGRPPILIERFLTHMAFLPIVAGASFEALKASGTYRNSKIVGALITPGLWLQKLTTRQPDDEQLGVAVAAARASLGQTVAEAADL
jgi:uncharacterized protein YqhQ